MEGHLIKQQFRNEERGQQRKERGAFCRGAEDPPHGTGSARSFDMCSLPRHPTFIAHGHRRSMEPRRRGDTTNSLPVLPAMHATEAARRTGTRGIDDSLDLGSPAPRKSVGGMRHADPKAQEPRDEWGWRRMDHLLESGASATRETSAQLPPRDERGDQRESRGAEDTKRGRPAKRERRFHHFLVARGRPRERSRGERKGQEGQREGRWQESGEVEVKGSAIMKSGYEDAASLVSRQPLFPEISTSEHLDGDEVLDTDAEGRLHSPNVPAYLAADPALDHGSKREKICMKPPSTGDYFSKLAPWMTFTLHESVSLLGLLLQCLTQPSGDIFPLPTDVKVLHELWEDKPEIDLLVKGLCVGLNSMYGLELENPFPPTFAQRRVLEFLRSQSQVVSSWDERFEETSWHDFFRLKTVNYTGEEVLCAQYTTWGNLSPAMPKEIASVPLSEVCELGCRHYVEHF